MSGRPPALGAPAVISSTTAAPPNYAASQPQILVAPLPDSASFFWGRTVQGEVFVKGLGQSRGSVSEVDDLSVKLKLTDLLPSHPDRSVHEFQSVQLYPPIPFQAESTSTPQPTQVPFSSIHRFSIPLPSTTSLPGTLNLSHYSQGELRYELLVTLTLKSGSTVTETVRVEGTPAEVSSNSPTTAGPSGLSLGVPDNNGEPKEVEQTILRKAVRTRVLLDSARPRLGDLLRLGVEVKPMPNEKAAMSNAPNPKDTLRPLRRVRVELFRRVKLKGTQSGPTSSASTATPAETRQQHLLLLYTSGKSLRYPGSSTEHPPLRVLFTIPTARLASMGDQTWGEITQSTPYHDVTFFVRVSIGFGATLEMPTSSHANNASDHNDWIIERDIEIRRKLWREPTTVVVQRGKIPDLGEDHAPIIVDGMTAEELAREAYRVKGRDVVGSTGTIRMDGPASHPDGDLPPPFRGTPTTEDEPDIGGPSGTTSRGDESTGLPSFLESEEQVRSGEAPLPTDMIPSQRLIPVNFDGDDEDGEDRATRVGRRGSLGGELGTWVEYDGYETFSVAPPAMSASFGVGGSMDPPQEGDDDVNVVGGIMGRLGLEGSHHGQSGREFIESLGLGEGTRVVDLQDDLPPGIDEPSLPALPDFSAHPQHHTAGYHQDHTHSSQHPPDVQRQQDNAQSHRMSPPRTGRDGQIRHQDMHQGNPPPSFAASEAAARRPSRSLSVISMPLDGQEERERRSPLLEGTRDRVEDGDAPPGYFGSGDQSGTGGPPAYS